MARRVRTTSYGVTEETLGKFCERRVLEEANFFELWRVVLLFLFLLGLLKKGLEEVSSCKKLKLLVLIVKPPA